MKKRKPAVVSAEDAALFREAIGEVVPLAAPAPAPAARRPVAEPRMRARDEAEALAESRRPGLPMIEAAEPLLHHRDTVPAKVFRQLRRGGYRVDAEVDLHGLRATDAERLLRRFLADARAEGLACVRVIHGKGLRTAEGGSVIKGLVDHLLRQRADVLAFASAPEAMGGTGAVLVLLARRRAGETGTPGP